MMTYTITVLQEEDLTNGIKQITQIDVDFNDEGVNLQGSVKVSGEWQGYLTMFEQDLRRNNAELFPVPEMPTMEGETI